MHRRVILPRYRILYREPLSVHLLAGLARLEIQRSQELIPFDPTCTVSRHSGSLIYVCGLRPDKRLCRTVGNAHALVYPPCHLVKVRAGDQPSHKVIFQILRKICAVCIQALRKIPLIITVQDSPVYRILTRPGKVMSKTNASQGIVYAAVISVIEFVCKIIIDIGLLLIVKADKDLVDLHGAQFQVRDPAPFCIGFHFLIQRPVFAVQSVS